ISRPNIFFFAMEDLCQKLRGCLKKKQDEEKFPILALPQEIKVHVIDRLDIPTRLALRQSCKLLYNAEAISKYNVEELSLFRTGYNEFTLSIKDALSDTWLLVKNQVGVNVRRWIDRGDTSFKEMKEASRLTYFRHIDTPLGELTAVLQEYLNRSIIGKVTIDGFHCTNSSMSELCDLLRMKSLDELYLSAPFSTTSDSPLTQLLHGCPKQRIFKLAIHRRIPINSVVERDFLLFATSRLEKLTIHSRVVHNEHSRDNCIVDDDLLITLLSDKCRHLHLVYFLPLLTAKGIVAAIEHLSSRKLPSASFSIYFRSELHDALWRLLGLVITADGTLSSTDRLVKISQPDSDNCIVKFGQHLEVKITRKSFVNNSPLFYKIAVKTTFKPANPGLTCRVL
ncbi:hypothetical protein PMAYCL1PPCAC_22908, partial [Pristionchus mayeri]